MIYFVYLKHENISNVAMKKIVFDFEFNGSNMSQ